MNSIPFSLFSNELFPSTHLSRGSDFPQQETGKPKTSALDEDFEPHMDSPLNAPEPDLLGSIDKDTNSQTKTNEVVKQITQSRSISPTISPPPLLNAAQTIMNLRNTKEQQKTPQEQGGSYFKKITESRTPSPLTEELIAEELKQQQKIPQIQDNAFVTEATERKPPSPLIEKLIDTGL